MEIDSIETLRCAFEQWRTTKKHVREPTPSQLLIRARRCAKRHGVAEVVRATGVDYRKFRPVSSTEKRAVDTPVDGLETAEASSVGFSRFELSAPSVAPQLIAEIESRSGVRLRLFQQTPEMIQLLGVLCGAGGA